MKDNKASLNLVTLFRPLSFTFWFLQSLRDRQKAVRENQAPNMKQMKMWSVSKNPVKILVQQWNRFDYQNMEVLVYY